MYFLLSSYESLSIDVSSNAQPLTIIRLQQPANKCKCKIESLLLFWINDNISQYCQVDTQVGTHIRGYNY